MTESRRSVPRLGDFSSPTVASVSPRESKAALSCHGPLPSGSANSRPAGRLTSDSQVRHEMQPPRGIKLCESPIWRPVDIRLKVRADPLALPDGRGEAECSRGVGSVRRPHLLEPLKLRGDHRSHCVCRAPPQPHRSPAAAEALSHALTPPSRSCTYLLKRAASQPGHGVLRKRGTSKRR
jgi:hypothetical protein